MFPASDALRAEFVAELNYFEDEANELTKGLIDSTFKPYNGVRWKKVEW